MLNSEHSDLEQQFPSYSVVPAFGDTTSDYNSRVEGLQENSDSTSVEEYRNAFENILSDSQGKRLFGNWSFRD